jgi:hypothetical protein
MTALIETERDLGRLNLQDELELLKADGFVDFFKSLAGIGSARVTALGANASEEFERARNSSIEWCASGSPRKAHCRCGQHIMRPSKC